jgi:branched-chain amino acid transport system permease protein
MEWLNAILQGILLGGLYALLATGLSLVFGVMRIVNLAQGDLTILAAFVSLTVVRASGLGPIESLIAVVPLMMGVGFLMQRFLLDRTIGRGVLPPVLVTFGLAIVLQNVLLYGYTADSRGLDAGPIETASIQLLPNLAVGVLPVVTLVVAVVILLGLQFVLSRTRLGRALRATSDDAETATLMGINDRRMYAVAMAIALGTVAVAGVFLGIRTTFGPSDGPARLIFAFEAVIIGGLGSLWGTLVGGIVIGVAQTVGAAINPEWQILAGHLAFLLVLLFKPRGLFPRAFD